MLGSSFFFPPKERFQWNTFSSECYRKRLTFRRPPAATEQNNVCGKANKYVGATIRTLGYRKILRERKKASTKEVEELGEGAMNLISSLEMELLTFVWSQSAVDTWNTHTHTHTHTHTSLSLSHTHTHTRTGSTPRQPGMCLADGGTPALVSCVCDCARRPWMVVIELKSLSHNIISLHLWGVDLDWMADYSQPGLLFPTREAWHTYGCPSACLSTSVCARLRWKHLTPVIIAFRVATGGISIHSGWGLFSGRGGREMFAEVWQHPFGPSKREEHIHLYIQLQILSVQMSFSDEMWGLTQQPWRRDVFFFLSFFFPAVKLQ